MQLVLENEKHEPTFLFKLLVIIGLCLFFIACSSPNVRQFSYEPSANPIQEIQKLDLEMQEVDSNQLSVFAPESYSRAQNAFFRARKQQDGGARREVVLQELSQARSYFEKAKQVSEKSLKALPQVAQARENALKAGAESNHKLDLRKIDSRLINLTKEFETRIPDISIQQRASLQKQYLDLELASIKTNRLTDTRILIESARRQEAQRYAPKAFKKAQASLVNAELTINTDRHDEDLVTAVSAKAMRDAQRALRVTDMVRKTGRPGNEDMAMNLILQQEELAEKSRQAREREEMFQSQIRDQESQLKAQSQLSSQLLLAQKNAKEAQKELEAKRKVDEAYVNSQNLFTDDEAEVYRQGNNLILRVKSINFPSGRAELPASAFETLGKVNGIISDLKARKVIVEGHTDATGSQETNQRVSQERADAVALFLKQQEESRLSGGVGPSSEQKSDLQIEPLGYGDEYPIATNKTKDGRAQNRRVDIIIAPEIVTE